METEKELYERLKVEKVRAMKNPIILMNTEDFESFKNELESKIVNFKVGDNPTFAGVPIKPTDLILKGTFTVVDDSLNWL